jgi:hypothetical protein
MPQPAVAIPVCHETDPVSAARRIPRPACRVYAGSGMRHRLRIFPRWPVALNFLRRPVALDVGIAVLLAALSVFTVWQLISPAAEAPAGKLAYEFGSLTVLHWRLAGWLAATLGELAVLPLRHRFPVVVFGVTLAMAVAHSLLLPVTPSPADLAVAVAIFTIADKRSRLVSAATAGFGLLLAVGTDTVLAAGTSPGKSSATSQVLLWQSMIVPALRPRGRVSRCAAARSRKPARRWTS